MKVENITGFFYSSGSACNVKFVLLFFCLQFLFSCSSNPENDTAQQEETEAQTAHEAHEDTHTSENIVELTARQYQIAGIKIGKPEQVNISNTLKVTGKVDVPPQNMVSVSAPLGGYVKETELLQGMRIRKGQSIAVIENPEFIEIQQRYLESQSQLEYLQQEYERQKELREENVNAAKTLQRAASEYKSMQAQVKGLAEKLQLININPNRLTVARLASTAHLVSPINGYVTDVLVNMGKYVTPTDVLFTIADTEHLHAELTVFERDAAKLRKGQQVRFTVPGEDRVRTATVYIIGKAVSGERTVRVHAHLDDEDTELLPGAFISAYIAMDSATVKALSEEAIVDFEGQAYIFLARGKQQKNGTTEYRFEMVPVQTGASGNGFVEILLPERVPENPDVVTAGAYTLLAKLKNTEDEGGHGH